MIKLTFKIYNSFLLNLSPTSLLKERVVLLMVPGSKLFILFSEKSKTYETIKLSVHVRGKEN